jgi:hypothetical protein
MCTCFVHFRSIFERERSIFSTIPSHFVQLLVICSREILARATILVHFHTVRSLLVSGNFADFTQRKVAASKQTAQIPGNFDDFTHLVVKSSKETAQNRSTSVHFRSFSVVFARWKPRARARTSEHERPRARYFL